MEKNYRKISGIIFYGKKPELIKGSIYIDENNNIYNIKKENVNSNYWIVPKFINMHTHIGDSVLKDPVLGIKNNITYQSNLDYLIKPPMGIKHKILSQKKDIDIIKSITNSLNEMYMNGTNLLIDFREGGMNGIIQVKNALKAVNNKVKALILSRPTKAISEFTTKNELKKLIGESDGFGISGFNDMEENIIYKLKEIAYMKKKIIAIHSGEKNNNDIKKAIDLNPNLLIHMNNASNRDLRLVKDKNIPIVICPRSNMITGVKMPPVKKMLEYDICIGIGTDNIMLNSPNMFEEINLLYKYFKLNENVIYSILAKNSKEMFPMIYPSFSSIIDIGNKANLMILNSKSYNLSGVFNPLSGFIRRARIDDIIQII